MPFSSRKSITKYAGYAAASLGLLALAVGQPAHAAPSDPAPLKVARLDYKITRLDNGLKVVTLEDHRAPVATIQVWYNVGSKDEQAQRSGFAHLFEHLMFKGSKNVGPQEHSNYVEAIGGDMNADTSFDRTRYYETVPSNALTRMIFLEADRMGSLIVDQPNLTSERQVVEEEYRLRVANAPYGAQFANVFSEVLPASHPYAHQPIGSIADLDAATLADVNAFHDQYYRPNNATLVIVGDFKTADVLQTVRQYFGPIKPYTKPFVRVPTPAITQTAPRNETFYDPLAPLPRMGVAYALPPPTSPDTPVFTIIQQILAGGESARLNRELVRDKRVAGGIGGGAFGLKLGGIFFIAGVPLGPNNIEPLQNGLADAMTRLRNEPVSAQELQAAKNQVLSQTVFGNITTMQKANALGEADLIYGTPEAANEELPRLNKVTIADVQRVARKYFTPERANYFRTLPASMKKDTTAK